MTQTLTTEELRQIVETDHTQCGDAAAMARELLANREAQPEAADVARRCCKNKNCNGPIIGYSVDGLCEDCYIAVSRSPAPRVNPELTRAPAVPGAISTRQAIVKMESHEPCDSINVAYKFGWNACRAAMLAQPVSGGCKLPADWRLDESTGAKILMYKDCSVIEDQQAEYVLSLIQAAAPEGGN